MQKIRSGQAYLYRDGGLRSTVFELRTRDQVRGDLLRRALELAMQRFPYFRAKLVERHGDFYLVENPLSVAFAKTDQFRALGSMRVNFHLIDVTYFQDKIRVAFHHALCDGRGVMPFIQTLVFCYCELRYAKRNQPFPSDGVRLPGSPLLPGETAEPFGPSAYEVAPTPSAEPPKPGFSLPESASRTGKSYRQELTIDEAALLAVARRHGATPAILVSLLTSRAIKRVHPEADKPIVCSLASDMRKELGLENTHRNCVSSLSLPYTPALEGLTLAEQAAIYRAALKEQKHPDAVKRAANAQRALSERLDRAGSFEEKQRLVSFFDDLCIDTFVLSYAGQLKLGACDQFVRSMHLYSGGNRGLILNMVSAGGCMTIDVLQSFESDRIVLELVRALEEVGLAPTVSPRLEFTTTPDRTFATGKWQAERFFLLGERERRSTP